MRSSESHLSRGKIETFYRCRVFVGERCTDPALGKWGMGYMSCLSTVRYLGDYSVLYGGALLNPLASPQSAGEFTVTVRRGGSPLMVRGETATL